MKLLILIDIDSKTLPCGSPTQSPMQTLHNLLRSELDYEGIEVERFDVEGVDGVTRDSILVDVLGEAQTEAEQVDLGIRLGQALARKDRQLRKDKQR